ncbi:flap endonuclease GEN-like 2 [Gossypium australe]|uniref:Flap endonuclease GEN-like 2 n=1 Tax=Gossypium australe TaxID=47621 RepID=A0A5B6UDF2_9ROSI|nr:flap endonuclease GEN-like 2 [Gossypium australe]
MRVKNLWDVLEQCKKTLPLHHLHNKKVCIDLSCWIVQLQNVNKSHCPINKKLYLASLFHHLRALIALNCSLIFVTGNFPFHQIRIWLCISTTFTHFLHSFVLDGSIPAIKLSTYRRRLNLRPEAQDGAKSHSQNLSSLKRNMGSEFSCMIKEAKLLGLALGIPCLDGIEEAEAQCALLNLESLCDGCFSSDSDIFLFGEGGHVVYYEMDDIERKLGFGRNSLICLALLLGSDYTQGVRGLGLEAACLIVKSVGDNDILRKIASEGLSFARKKKSSKKQGQVKCNDKETTLSCKVNMNGGIQNSQTDDQYLRVVEAYMNPKCHSADSDVVHSVHSSMKNCRGSILGSLSGPLKKQRLRRFAYLRSTSSQLDVNIPMKEVPVKCPVSAIIKCQKVHGRECFEVLWEEHYGIKSSVVPSDLVESACPEKIKEFDDKRALEKKNQIKSRPKKSGKQCSLTEIDQKLQHLLLDIELGSESSPMASREVISDQTPTATEVNFMNRDPPIISDSDCRATMLCQETDITAPKHEVIDLLSPSPQVQSRVVSRCTQMNDQHITIIDLSESKNKRSPKHVRKARVLRPFLASIRDDFN